MIRNVAILGAGIGEKHLVAYAKLTKHFKVTTICDLDLSRAAHLANMVGAKVSDNLDAVIADPTIDLIDICLPPPMHVGIATKALAASKDVILEKPIAGSLNDAELLIQHEKKSGKRVFPVFQYRYGRAFDIIKQLKEAGFLKRPLTASSETHWDRRSDYYAIAWRGTWDHELGGAVLSHAIHAHDLLAMAFGQIANVSAFTATRANPIETEDCASITFRHANGATSTSSITLGSAGNSSRIKLIFDDMTIESDADERFAYTPGEADWQFIARKADQQSPVNEIIANTPKKPEGFEGFCKAVADALDGNPGTEVALSEGVAAIELASAIYHSDRTGSQVSLPLDRTLPICRGFKP